jgi:hypothetical protein
VVDESAQVRDCLERALQAQHVSPDGGFYRRHPILGSQLASELLFSGFWGFDKKGRAYMSTDGFWALAALKREHDREGWAR